MDRETLVSAFATLWSDMAQMRDVASQYRSLKSEAEARMEYIIKALFEGEHFDRNELNDIMREACELAGLASDHPLVRTVESELKRIEREYKEQAMREQASMN